MRNTMVIRQWRLLRALASCHYGLTLSQLRDRAGDGASERTVRRDIHALSQAGFPIEGGNPARYRLNLSQLSDSFVEVIGGEQ